MRIPFRIERFEALASTQDAMRERLVAGESVHGLVIRAARQWGGRGRRGRGWESALGGSYQTLAVRDPEPPLLRRGVVTVALAIGLAEVFSGCGIKVGIKWPNDLYYRQKKLGGVLAEYWRGHLLIGVGINVNNEVPVGAVGLRGWVLEDVHGLVLEGLQRGLALLVRGEDLPGLFWRYDLLWSQAVTFEAGRGEQVGIAAGVTALGCLKIRCGGRCLLLCRGRLLRYPLKDSRAGVS